MVEEGVLAPIEGLVDVSAEGRNPVRIAAIKIILKVDEPFSVADRIDGVDGNRSRHHFVTQA
jgi:hypothetical protein